MVVDEVLEVEEEEFGNGESKFPPLDLAADSVAGRGGNSEVEEEDGEGGNGGGMGNAAAPDCSSAFAMLRRMASTGSVTTKVDRRNDPSRRSTKYGNGSCCCDWCAFLVDEAAVELL